MSDVVFVVSAFVGASAVLGAWSVGSYWNQRDKRLRQGDVVQAERQRIWTEIVRWEEGGASVDEGGNVVPIEGFRHQPLAPFFRELHAIVFGSSDRSPAGEGWGSDE